MRRPTPFRAGQAKTNNNQHPTSGRVSVDRSAQSTHSRMVPHAQHVDANGHKTHIEKGKQKVKNVFQLCRKYNPAARLVPLSGIVRVPNNFNTNFRDRVRVSPPPPPLKAPPEQLEQPWCAINCFDSSRAGKQANNKTSCPRSPPPPTPPCTTRPLLPYYTTLAATNLYKICSLRPFRLTDRKGGNPARRQ